MQKAKPTYVTAPSLPPLEEYTDLLQGIWDRKILTHNGPLVQRLEKELKEKYDIRNLVVVTNGTIAIQLAIKALDLNGSEIITTPFTWIATASAVQWENCTPRFADIDPQTFNIDPNRVEAAITDKTRAIMGVHVFSNPCDIEAIEYIARKHNLKVIYDAAHAMCVNYKGKSVLEYGDISAASFHATKIFNSGEGGCCVAVDSKLNNRLKRLRFFGHNDDKEIVDVGCNGKMTEIHAALGLANLKYIDSVLSKRKEIFDSYYSELADLDFITFQSFHENSYNYSYMPIVLDSEERLLKVLRALESNEIFAKRYFYPSLNTIKSLARHDASEHSEKIASTILCLPSYSDLSLEKVENICQIITRQ